MSYWKTKVVPKFKKVFDTDKDGKKAAAAEFSKSFDGSKEDITKEIEEKKIEIETKVVETYEASPTEIKSLVKERKAGRVKKYSVHVTKFLEELVTIEFPGAKQVSEAAAKSGPVLVSGPILFVLEKVSTFVVVKEETKPEEPKPEAPAAEPAAAEETTREVVVEVEEKKEEIVEKVEETLAPEPAPAEPVAEPAKPADEPPKP